MHKVVKKATPEIAVLDCDGVGDAQGVDEAAEGFLFVFGDTESAVLVAEVGGELG